MDGKQMLELIRILVIALGCITVVWGIYDMFGDGQSNSSGIKKIFGGIAVAVVGGVALTAAANQVGQAQQQAGVAAFIPHSVLTAPAPTKVATSFNTSLPL